MVVTTYRIVYSYGDTIKIKPIFDVHWGNSYCDKRAFREYLADSDKDTYFFGGGDSLDSIIVKDVRRYEKHSDDTETDAVVDEQIEGFAKELEPYKNRLVGLGRGNHEQAILKYCSTDPTQRLCNRLGCPNLGYSGLIRLIFTQDKGGRGRQVVIRWHHGWGGGSRTQGADLTKFSRDLVHWDADVFLYGHVHKLQRDSVPRLGLVGEKLVSKPKIMGICGSFLKTYSNSTEATYSEVKGYPPITVGGLTVCIKITRHWVKAWIEK